MEKKRSRSKVQAAEAGGASASSKKKKGRLSAKQQEALTAACRAVVAQVRAHASSKLFEEGLAELEKRLGAEEEFAGPDFYAQLVSLFLDPERYEATSEEHSACYVLLEEADRAWRVHVSLPQVLAGEPLFKGKAAVQGVGEAPSEAEKKALVKKMAALSGRQLVRMLYLLRQQTDLDFGTDITKMVVDVDAINDESWKKLRAFL